MGLVIKFLGQPYPGREITIDENTEEVKFGRGIDCEVGFPEDMAIVSRSHFALKRELDGYKFVINREKPVFMNGRPVYDDQDLPKIAEIQLSGPTGPKLRLERLETGAGSNQVKTEILRPQKGMADVVDETRTTGRRTSSMLGVLALVVAVLGAGSYAAYQYFNQRVDTLDQQLAQIVTKIPEKVDTTATATAGPAPATLSSIISKNKESVYLVAVQLPSGTRDGQATASVITMPDGTKALATNSHVADLYNEIVSNPALAGAKLVVTQPKAPGYQTLEVVRIQKHPGYDVFNKWQERYFVKAQTLSAQRMEFVPGFDVALLFVADPTQLGEPLTYASRETIENLPAGEQLIMIGYPAEMLNGTSAMKPEPTSQTGIVTSMTTFFLSRGENKDDLLVQHSVPATGGASGSPMFNNKGEVVAFLNAGNIVLVKNQNGDTVRIPSSALVNYAQRGDLLLDLAEGKADAKMPEYTAQMERADEELTKTPDVFIKDLVALFGQDIGDQARVTKVTELEAETNTPVPWMDNRKGAGIEVTLDQPGVYLIAGASLDKRLIQTSAYEIQQDGSVKPLKEGPGLTPYSFVVVGRNQPGKIFVVVADMSENGTKADAPAGKVKIHVYRGDPNKGS